MKKFVSLFVLILLSASAWCQSHPNYTVIVSLDGFRWDYPVMYNTPHLDQIAARGSSGTMLPSYPASTFPNHYTLATGLVPDHHGIVNNTFWDTQNNRQYSMNNPETRFNPAYYLGEPIWVTAQKQGVKTANMYWVAADIPIKNTFPTYQKLFRQKPQLTFEERIDTVISWLRMPEEARPQLVMLYFEEPDGTGHHFGPRSLETKRKVEYLDSLVGVLMHKISRLPIADRINLIVTSDHGMTEISDERVVNMHQYLKPEWCRVIDGKTPTSVFTKPEFRDSVYNSLKNVPHIHVWKKEEIPAELHYGSSDRIGDIVIAPATGWQFAEKGAGLKGAHGYFPQEPDMQVIFRAYGPDFKEGYRSKGFVNVDIYPLLCYLLHVKPAKNDGQPARIADLINQTSRDANPIIP